ncbi:MAG TPA: IS30 family transposase [Candidatus Acidoferrum sp.]|nr:IS30 family transposase [Candidatus Acidoferrum sp.]
MPAEAAVAVGLSPKTGEGWFRQAGGVIPAHVLPPPCSRYLSLLEREEIFAGVERGDSIRAIARRLGREPSTVLRELRRNMQHMYRTRWRLAGLQGRPRVRPWDYRPSLAQKRAEQLSARPKVAKLAGHDRLRDLIQTKLLLLLSPQQIAIWLRREFPQQPEMWVSHETIYRSIYVQGRGALRRELAVCLRTGRALRKPQRKSDERRGRIPGLVSISERPAEVEDRAVPGHWEGDLILGRNGRSAIGTLVERKTRFLMLLHLPRGHGAIDVEQAMLAATEKLPQALWKSLTWDRGMEMRRHAEISIATGLDIYFCDPAKPWQRGSNENTNGLLRQYFPKGTDLSSFTAAELDYVSWEMNQRPRMTLGWDTPAQALDKLLSAASSEAGVATTG